MLRFNLRRDNRPRKIRAQECSAVSRHPYKNFAGRYRPSQRTCETLIEDVPNDAAPCAATIAKGRLPKGAGELPFLSFDAPLNGCVAKDIV
jgi:hypothetical protein